jgi:hypothetical protein
MFWTDQFRISGRARSPSLVRESPGRPPCGTGLLIDPARLKAAGIDHQLISILGAAHTPTVHLDAIIETTAAFVWKALQK